MRDRANHLSHVTSPTTSNVIHNICYCYISPSTHCSYMNPTIRWSRGWIRGTHSYAHCVKSMIRPLHGSRWQHVSAQRAWILWQPWQLSYVCGPLQTMQSSLFWQHQSQLLRLYGSFSLGQTSNHRFLATLQCPEMGSTCCMNNGVRSPTWKVLKGYFTRLHVIRYSMSHTISCCMHIWKALKATH